MFIGQLHARVLEGSRRAASISYIATYATRAISTFQRTKKSDLLVPSPRPQRCLISTSSNLPNKIPSNSNEILVQQRLRRPLSPHLSIYRPQITSTLSVLMRITGLAMSGTFCVYPLLYLASPLLGIDVSVASLVTIVDSWPAFVKLPLKLAVAWTFTFHGFNSLRFLSWDMARGITNKRVTQTGWAVVGVSFASALALVTLV